jgi:CheY-like chemotaxis protein
MDTGRGAAIIEAVKGDPTNAPWNGIRVLVAEDDEAMRVLLVAVLRATEGVASVVEAVDGAEAVALGRRRRLDVALLDLNMPRLDGIEAAARLRARQPWLQIALHSTDVHQLYERASGLGLPLFDKLQLDDVLEWVEGQTENEPALAAGVQGR